MCIKAPQHLQFLLGGDVDTIFGNFRYRRAPLRSVKSVLCGQYSWDFTVVLP